MDSDFLCTQAITDDFDDTYVDDEDSNDENERKQVGCLKVLPSKKTGIPAIEFPIYVGENIVGRHTTCDISIPWSVALSKKHALLEGEGDALFVTDSGSSNKTRLGKTKLKPNVKYGLRDNDELIFGDVKCIVYQTSGSHSGKTVKDVITSSNVQSTSSATPKGNARILASDTPDHMMSITATVHNTLNASTSTIPESQPPALNTPVSSERSKSGIKGAALITSPPIFQLDETITHAEDTGPLTHDLTRTVKTPGGNEISAVDISHVTATDSDEDTDYHPDSDTDIEDNTVETEQRDATLATENVYEADTIELTSGATSQATIITENKPADVQDLGSDDDDDEYEMSMIANLGSEQTQMFPTVAPETPVAAKSLKIDILGPKTTEDPGESSSTDDDEAILSVDLESIGSQSLDATKESSSKEQENEVITFEDKPECSGMSIKNPEDLEEDVPSSAEQDSFGDLCTQAFSGARKMDLFQDTLGMLETQAFPALPPKDQEEEEEDDDEDPAGDSMLFDMPTQAFPGCLKSPDEVSMEDDGPIVPLEENMPDVGDSVIKDETATESSADDAEVEAGLFSGSENKNPVRSEDTLPLSTESRYPPPPTAEDNSGFSQNPNIPAGETSAEDTEPLADAPVTMNGHCPPCGEDSGTPELRRSREAAVDTSVFPTVSSTFVLPQESSSRMRESSSSGNEEESHSDLRLQVSHQEELSDDESTQVYSLEMNLEDPSSTENLDSAENPNSRSLENEVPPASEEPTIRNDDIQAPQDDEATQEYDMDVAGETDADPSSFSTIERCDENPAIAPDSAENQQEEETEIHQLPESENLPPDKKNEVKLEDQLEQKKKVEEASVSESIPHQDAGPLDAISAEQFMDVDEKDRETNENDLILKIDQQDAPDPKSEVNKEETVTESSNLSPSKAKPTGDLALEESATSDPDKSQEEETMEEHDLAATQAYVFTTSTFARSEPKSDPVEDLLEDENRDRAVPQTHVEFSDKTEDKSESINREQDNILDDQEIMPTQTYVKIHLKRSRVDKILGSSSKQQSSMTSDVVQKWAHPLPSSQEQTQAYVIKLPSLDHPTSLRSDNCQEETQSYVLRSPAQATSGESSKNSQHPANEGESSTKKAPSKRIKKIHPKDLKSTKRKVKDVSQESSVLPPARTSRRASRKDYASIAKGASQSQDDVQPKTSKRKSAEKAESSKRLSKEPVTSSSSHEQGGGDSKKDSNSKTSSKKIIKKQSQAISTQEVEDSSKTTRRSARSSRLKEPASNKAGEDDVSSSTKNQGRDSKDSPKTGSATKKSSRTSKKRDSDTSVANVGSSSRKDDQDSVSATSLPGDQDAEDSPNVTKIISRRTTRRKTKVEEKATGEKLDPPEKSRKTTKTRRISKDVVEDEDQAGTSSFRSSRTSLKNLKPISEGDGKGTTDSNTKRKKESRTSNQAAATSSSSKTTIETVEISESSDTKVLTKQNEKPDLKKKEIKEKTISKAKESKKTSVKEELSDRLSLPSSSQGSSGSRTTKRKRRNTSSSTASSSSSRVSSTPAKKQKSDDTDMEEQTSATRALRPKREKPKVMFTGILDTVAEAIVTNLGGKLATDIHDCTHLVTDKMRRTIKFLCAVTRGIHIVTQKWLHLSEQHNRFLPEEDFELSEDLQSPNEESIEEKYNFQLKTTLESVRQSLNPLFHGLEIFVTKNVAPPPEQMNQILECAGAKLLPKMPPARGEEGQMVNKVIIATPSDKRVCATAVKAGCNVVTNEFVLTGILRHQVDFNSHKLFDSCGDTQGVSGAGETPAKSSKSAVSPKKRNHKEPQSSASKRQSKRTRK